MGETKLPLGERMKRLRQERGWSQSELAGQIGGDGRQISRYENGHIVPSVEALTKIAEALDISTDFLLFESIARRPLHVPDNGISERLLDLSDLGEDDRKSLFHILDALVAKTKFRSLVREME